MAVAVGGFYGAFFGEYMAFSDSRNWNTKNYDYAYAANKGELSESLVNEYKTGGIDSNADGVNDYYQTALLLKTNKNGYLNSNQGFIKAEDPVYILTNRDGTVNNSYYIDQETGDIYLRPRTVTAAGGVTNEVNNQAYNPTTPTTFALNLNGATSATATQSYNWGTVGNGHSVSMHSEYFDGVNWVAIPGTNVNLSGPVSGTTGSPITYSVPLNASQIRVVGTTTVGTSTSTVSNYSGTYDFASIAAGPNNSNTLGAFDLSIPGGSTGTATVQMKYNWTIPSGGSATPVVQYNTGSGWNSIPATQVSLTTNAIGQTIQVAVPPAAMTATTQFRVQAPAAVGSASNVVTPYTDNYMFNPIVSGTQYSSTIKSYDLSGATSATIKMDYGWFTPDPNGVPGSADDTSVTVVVQKSTNGGTTWADIAGTQQVINPTVAGNGSTATIALAGPFVVGEQFRIKATAVQAPSTTIPDGTLFAVPNPVPFAVFPPPPSPPNPATLNFAGGPSSVSLQNNITMNNPHSNVFSRLEYTTDGTSWIPLGASPQSAMSLGTYNTNQSYGIDMSGNPYYADFSFGLNYPATHAAIYGYMEYYDTNDSNWHTIAGSTFSKAANVPGAVTLTANMTFPPTTMSNVRLATFFDAAYTSPAAAGGTTFTTTTASSDKRIAGGTEVVRKAESVAAYTASANQTYSSAHPFVSSPATHVRLGVYSDPLFTVPATPSGVAPSLMQGTTHFAGSVPGPLPSHLSTSVTVEKTVNSAGLLPTFIDSPNNLLIEKTITTPPGSLPTWTSGNLTVTKDVSGLNGITLPTEMPAVSGTTQYFGTTFVLDEVPNPEQFGDLQPNNLKFSLVDPAAYTGLPAGLFKLDYADLELNGVKIASNFLDTVTVPAIPPLTNPQSAHYTFANNFSSGVKDFSAVAGGWAYDEINGEYRTGPAGYANTSPIGVQQSYFNERTTDNFVVSADIKITTASPGFNPKPISGLGDFVGFRLRATNSDDNLKESGYLVAYESGGNIKIYNAGEVTTPVVASFIAPPLTPIGTTSRKLEVHANGNSIDVYVDGLQVGSYIDAANKFSNGYTSLVSLGHEASFDNFRIQSYASPIQLLASALRKGQNTLVVKGLGNGPGVIDVSGTIGGINISTSNIPPDLNTLNGGQTDIMSNEYRDSGFKGLQGGELDPLKAYWSTSIKSSLGIAGRVEFKMREGGSVHNIRDQFTGINNIMQNLTSILGMTDDLFKTHLNIIK